MKREQLLETAKQTVCHDRNDQYGEPEDSFDMIAKLWSAYLCGRVVACGQITSGDVANMMILLKVARQAATPKDDNYVDIAGYAACGSEVSDAEAH